MRALALSLLFLGALGVADGNLLRPCHCGEDGALSCGLCPKSKAQDLSRVPPCCRHKLRKGQPSQPKDGLRICPGPREPQAQPEAAPVLTVSLLPLFLDAPVARVPAAPDAIPVRGELPPAMPRDGPWRLAPEGTTAFLI